MMIYDAFFISPTGGIIPVPVRHIVAISKEPWLFGLTLDHVQTVYKKHKENVGWEGYARNEIILNLLKQDWVRLRFSARSGTWMLQIHDELNDRLKKNILLFCQAIKNGSVTNAMRRTADPNIEIHNSNEGRFLLDTLDKAIIFLGS